MNKESATRMHVRHFHALLLAAGLFAFHTAVLFETAHHAIPFHAWISQIVGHHAAGISVILACFFILFIAHCAESAAWAAFFWRTKIIPTYGESFYFSLTSMTSLGYGDVVLRPPWRTLGGLAAVNGLLMFGCSTAFLFLVIQRIWLREI